MKTLLITALLISSTSYAQDQLAVRVNEQGIMRVLQMAVKYNTSSNSSRTLVIPEKIYPRTIKKKNFVNNPIVGVLNSISDLNMNKDIPFFLHTSKIKVTGNIDKKSVKAIISDSSPSGFNIAVKVTVPQVTADLGKTGSISVCEDLTASKRGCGKGIKATIKALKINTFQAPILLTANMRVSIKNNIAQVKFVSVDSNIGKAKGPKLNINFDSVDVPPIKVTIDNQVTMIELKTLKDEILKNEAFLGHTLMNFAAEFLAEDLVDMVNHYLINKRFNTSIDIYRGKFPTRNTSYEAEELDLSDDFQLDNLYVRPKIAYSFAPIQAKPAAPVVLPKKPVIDLKNYSPSKTPAAKIDNLVIAPRVLAPVGCANQSSGGRVNIGEILEDQLGSIIHNAAASLSLKSISTPLNKDIQLSGLLSLVLNGDPIRVQNRLGNQSVASLPQLNLGAHRLNDINLAISEPVLNAALDLANDTGLFEEVFDDIAKTQGATLKSVQIHFAKDNSIRAIANMEIDLNKVKTNGFSSWIQTQIGAFLERNNNNGRIYFPLEISIVPKIQTKENGNVGLSLLVKSPFSDAGLINSYDYPSNISKMKEMVRDGVLKQLKDALCGLTDKSYFLDLTKYLNQSGVVFKPKTVSIEQGAYLLINLDIADIKFNRTHLKKNQL